MKRLLFFVFALSVLISCDKGNDDTRLVIITFDGLRWQEMFTGANEDIMNNPKYVSDIEMTKTEFWRSTPEERRKVLFPFLWSYVPEHGYIVGNRNLNSPIQVANTKWYSYPGYAEMFSGWADDERISSNDAVENPNTNVLEIVNRDPRYNGSVMMLASWESIPYALSFKRAGIPGSAGHMPCYVKTPMTDLLQKIDDMSNPNNVSGGERSDDITYGFALEVLKEKHPKVFYVGFGGTDGFAHAGKYDMYLASAKATDEYIRNIVEVCEANPFYKDKTTYLIYTDHGRGHGNDSFKDHGTSARGSNQIWFMAFGKGVPVLGETENNGTYYLKQVAATIADILKVDFTPDNGVKCDPIDPSYLNTEPPVAEASFEAVQANPIGHGIRYKYFEGDYLSVVPYTTAPVKASGIATEISTVVQKRDDFFGLIFNGLIKIPADGLYQILMLSDDGSKLLLNGKELLDLDVDGGGYADKWIDLKTGYHRIEVQYFENYGGQALEVGLIGPGISVERIPADMFFYE